MYMATFTRTTNNYSLIWTNSMRQDCSSEVKTWSVKKFLTCYWNRWFITVFTTCHRSLPWAICIESTPTRPISFTPILILPFHPSLVSHFCAQFTVVHIVTTVNFPDIFSKFRSVALPVNIKKSNCADVFMTYLTQNFTCLVSTAQTALMFYLKFYTNVLNRILSIFRIFITT
jgi:hypothetical protein